VLYAPEAHGRQPDGEDMPLAVAYVPGPHANIHAPDRPRPVLNRAAWHWVHAVLFVVVAVNVVVVLGPSMSEVPAGHNVHEVLLYFADAKLPKAHTAHDEVAPDCDTNVPLSHCVHTEFPTVDANVPAGHNLQSSAAHSGMVPA
jgi:hypothetical protein